MTRRASLLLAIALLTACGDESAIPSHDLMLRITAPTEEVELGAGFPLDVVRIWAKDLEPAEWSDDALAPLVAHLEDTTRREDDVRIEETRRYRCYAFQLTDVTVPAVWFTATPRAGGTPREVEGEGFAVRVRPALDPAVPGEVEFPGPPLREPFPWIPWSFGAAFGLLALSLLVRHTRRRRPPDVAAPAPRALFSPAPFLDRLRRIRERRPDGPAEMRADYVELAALLREYVAGCFGVGVPQMTSEELVAALAAAEATPHAALFGLLTGCDLVKFARHVPSAPDRERFLDSAEDFISEAMDA